MFAHRITASIAGTGIAAAALGFAALGFAGSAGASATDSAFLAQLAADGITPPSASTAITDAHGVCRALDQGASPASVYSSVAVKTGLGPKASKTFAVDAASAYCPQYVTST